jgi:hypothetical protein
VRSGRPRDSQLGFTNAGCAGAATSSALPSAPCAPASKYVPTLGADVPRTRTLAQVRVHRLARQRIGSYRFKAAASEQEPSSPAQRL